METDTTAYDMETAMIIDDNELDLMIARNIMARSGFASHILTMASGIEALEYLNNHTGENKLPEVIFLDINMPGMDGFGYLAAYDNCHKTIKDHCKIVVLTSSAHPKDLKNMMKDPYVVRFISKPLTPDDLTAVYHETKP